MHSSLSKFSMVYVVVSPPRCSSTAFARVFWEHPSIGYYNHEPFEVTYYDGAPLESVYEKLNNPLDLKSINGGVSDEQGSSLIIKEMPYQVGDHFPLLASWTKKPIIFLIRDPRLNIQSRITKKLEVGDSPFYPFQESGWHLIYEQVQYCKDNDIAYNIVNASDFRNHATSIFSQIFENLSLNFSEEMLSWESLPEVEIDNLEGSHSHLYKKVLSSTSLRPTSEAIPELEFFTSEQGVRDHVIGCIKIYDLLQKDQWRILPC